MDQPEEAIQSNKEPSETPDDEVFEEIDKGVGLVIAISKAPSEVNTEGKPSPFQDSKSIDNELKKTPTRDVEPFSSPSVEAFQYRPIYKRVPKEAELEEISEISGQEFKKKSPDKKADQSIDSRPIVFDSKGKAHPKDNNQEGFDAQNDTFNPNSRIEEYKVKDEFGGQRRDGNNKNYWNEQDQEIPVNCVMVYNLEPRVDEEILSELFCKVGKIKKLKLFRLSKRDIELSHYLKTLNLTDPKARPHKKKALIEYHAPNYVESAIEVFDGLELFGRKIFVMRYQDHYLKYSISIIRPKGVLIWLDEYFCLDYFSKVTNLVRVTCKAYPDNNLKYILFFLRQQDWEDAKEAIEKELKNYLNNRIQISYRPSSDRPPQERRRDQKSRQQPRPPQGQQRYLSPPRDGAFQFSDEESDEERTADIEVE